MPLQLRLGNGQLGSVSRHRRHLQDAVDLGRLVGKTQNDLELLVETHHRLVIAHDVGRRAEVHLARDRTSSSKKTRSQGTFDILENDHGIAFVKARRERVSNSLTAYCSNGLRTQIDDPSLPVGTAQVTA